MEWVSGRLGMMWGPSRQCGDDGDDVGTMWGRRGQHVETTDHGDHMGTFWGLWGRRGQHGDDVGMTGMTGMTWG